MSAHEIDCKFPPSLDIGLVESSNKLQFWMGRVDTCMSIRECMFLEKNC